MPNLEAEVDELIKIFPRGMDGLDVILPINNPDELVFVYLQRKTEDTRRNWDSYEEQERKNREHIQKQQGRIKLPLKSSDGSLDDFDNIYRTCMSYIKDGLILPDDKVLLEVHLRRDTETKGDIAYLVRIQRNRRSDLKRLGEEFYNNMLPWLKNRGYNFLKALPENPKLEPYWQRLGQVPIASLDVELREYLTTPKMASRTHVHILS